MRRVRVNGRKCIVDEDDLEEFVRDFKDTVRVEIEPLNEPQYDAVGFWKKANDLYQLHDYVQAHEKLWASASFAVKELCLQLGVRLVSHNAKRFVASAMIEETKKMAIPFNELHTMAGALAVGWSVAQRCHSAFNELSLVEEDEWLEKYNGISDFIGIVSTLSKNDEFRRLFAATLRRGSDRVRVVFFRKYDEEEFAGNKYRVNCKIV